MNLRKRVWTAITGGDCGHNQTHIRKTAYGHDVVCEDCGATVSAYKDYQAWKQYNDRP